MDIMPQKRNVAAQSLLFQTQRRFPIVLAVDRSQSMTGAPIASINAGLHAFAHAVSSDPIALKSVELCIVAFDTSVDVVQDFATIDQIVMPNLQAGGSTAMATAVTRALAVVEARKTEYRAHGIDYYRPLIFLLTDGASMEPLDQAAAAVAVAEQARQAAFIAIGVDGADFGELSRLSVRPVLQLLNADFKALIEGIGKSAVVGSRAAPGAGMAINFGTAPVITVSAAR